MRIPVAFSKLLTPWVISFLAIYLAMSVLIEYWSVEHQCGVVSKVSFLKLDTMVLLASFAALASLTLAAFAWLGSPRWVATLIVGWFTTIALLETIGWKIFFDDSSVECCVNLVIGRSILALALFANATRFRDRIKAIKKAKLTLSPEAVTD